MMSSLEYDLLSFEAQYYLNMAISTQAEAREMLDKSREYLTLARETRDRARELVGMAQQHKADAAEAQYAEVNRKEVV